MSGNRIGLLFNVTSFGESHGPAIGCIVDGCPPGLTLAEADIQRELDRRKPGTSSYVTPRKEADQVNILSGVFAGITTGAPIALIIFNNDQRSEDYTDLRHTFRPGHADYTYWRKYGNRDYRGGGRASARETATRVAAGAIAKKWLHQHYKLTIRSYLSKIGEITIPFQKWEYTSQNPFSAPNLEIVPTIADYLTDISKQNDSIGAQITVVANHVPAGLGEPVFDRLDADIAHAMMSINAVKGVEIGAGFTAVQQRGSIHGDMLTPEGFVSNHAGGVLGGISSGQDIIINIALKPTSSIGIPRSSINEAGIACEVATKGRHDPCVGLRAPPIAEAMLALVLMDHALRQRAQNNR